MSDDEVIEAARIGCIEAALEAYEDAGVRGLCAEGRWECAVEAMRRLDLGRVIALGTEGIGADGTAGTAPPGPGASAELDGEKPSP